MKKSLMALIAILLIFSLAGCAKPDPTAPPSLGEAVAGDKSAAELAALADQYCMDGNYVAAFLAVERLAEISPSDDAYLMKAQLRIMAMEAAQEALNAMIAEDAEKVSDLTGYKEQVAALYQEAGLQLVMPFTPDYTSPDEINTVGNTALNLNSAIFLGNSETAEYQMASVWLGNYSGALVTGLLAFQGEWLYYADRNGNFALYKMRSDGSDRQCVCTDAAGQINVIGDWIYFCNMSDGNSLYKVRTDGSSKTRLAEGPCRRICVKGDWIHYTDEDNILYRIRTDGKGRERLDYQAGTIFYGGETMFFSSPEEQALIHWPQGGEPAPLFEEWNVQAQVIDGWLYYLADRQGLVIMRMRPDGSEQTELWRYEFKTNFFTIVGDRLIAGIRTPKGAENILVINMETMEQVLEVDSAGAEAICADARGNTYMINPEGLYRFDLDTGAFDQIS